MHVNMNVKKSALSKNVTANLRASFKIYAFVITLILRLLKNTDCSSYNVILYFEL